MKRLDRHLLTHYPLLWNLRLHLFWPAILLMHLLFFGAGFAAITLPGSYSDYSLRPGEGVVAMAILVALVLAVFWLVLYLRNNAFKKFYPIRRGRLFAEFGLQTITFLGLCSFAASYAGGSYTHMRSLTAAVDLTQEGNIVSLANHFLPFNQQSFSQSSDCDFVQSNSTGLSTDTFSYLHFCADVRFRNGEKGALSIFGADSIAKRWLRDGKQDSVRHLLTQYLALCNKYGAGYKFSADAQVAEIFATPLFLVRKEIGRGDYEYRRETYEGVNQKLHDSYIEHDKVEVALSTVRGARAGYMRGEDWLRLAYIGLGFALLLFSFRATNVRTWFIALIGAGIWMAVFGVLAASGAGGGDGISLMVLFLILSIGFLIASAYAITGRRSKRSAGVMLVWAFWSFAALLPLFCALLQTLTRPRFADNYYYRDYGRSADESPVHRWIRDHWDLIMTANFLLVLLMTALIFIPLARKWQAAPEE